jgi:hypothetical protein
MAIVRDLVDEQVAANASGSENRQSFEGHRRKVTALLLERALSRDARLCLLGAGNANDVDLEALLGSYAEVHLVDLDPEALTRAKASVPTALAPRLVGHAPVDVSGALDKLEDWRAFRVTPEELMGHADSTARALLQATGGPFEVVASTCLLTQIQRAPVAILGDSHRLFEAVRHTMTVTHLRVLHALTRPGGTGVLITDVSADAIAPLPEEDEKANFVPLVSRLAKQGAIFQVAQPELIRAIAKDDPVLSKGSQASRVLDAWIWQNGPTNRFLVYALELERVS